VVEDELAVWDTSGLDGLYAIRLNVVTVDNQIQTSVIQVTVDNTPPQARILYPSQGAQISLGSDKTLNLAAEVSDGLGIRQVEWLLDGRKIGNRIDDPIFNLQWTATSGEHRLLVRVTDLAGNITESEPVIFTVK